MSDEDERRAYHPPEVVEGGKVQQQPGPANKAEVRTWLEHCKKGCSKHGSCPLLKKQDVGWVEHCTQVYKELKEVGERAEPDEPLEPLRFTSSW